MSTDRLSRPPLDPAACEVGYNARLAVPDHAQYFARWPQWAADTRAALHGELNLRYGPQPRETLDWFPAERPRGAFLFIHGGYWRAFSKDENSWPARTLVPLGISVGVLNYPLCPAVSVGDITDSARRALAFLYRRLNPAERSTLVVGGHSAGGHLTAALFATDWSAHGLPAQPLAGGLSISGIFDLIPLCYTSFNDVLGLTPDTAAAWSPLAQQPTQRGPLLLAVGADEPAAFHEQSERLAAAWPTVARPVQRLAGCHHFSAVEQLADAGSALSCSLLSLYPDREVTP